MHPRWFKITSFIDCDRCSLFIDRQAPYSGDALCQLRRVLRAVSNQILALAVTFHWLTYPPPPWPDLRPVTTSIHMHISCLPFLWWLSAWTWLIAAIILYHSLSFSIILSFWLITAIILILTAISLWLWLIAAIILSHCVRQRCWSFWRRCRRLFCCLIIIYQQFFVINWIWCLLMIYQQSTPSVNALSQQQEGRRAL